MPVPPATTGRSDSRGPRRQHDLLRRQSDPPADWSEVPFVGESYTGYVEPGYAPVAFTVADGSSWLFNGTGLSDGEKVPGLLLSDFDQFQPGESPPNLQILAHSPMPRDEVQSNVSDPASDTSYYRSRIGGRAVRHRVGVLDP
jgi:hypothetical protein